MTFKNLTLMTLKNASSPIMEQLIFFYDLSMMFIVVITTIIIYILTFLLFNNLNNKFIIHNQMLETIWTMIPASMLIYMAIPSLNILYLSDEMSPPSMTVKIIGHQWYWSYEYSDFPSIEYDSFMLNNNYQSIQTPPPPSNYKSFNYNIPALSNNCMINSTTDNYMYNWINKISSYMFLNYFISNSINNTYIFEDNMKFNSSNLSKNYKSNQSHQFDSNMNIIHNLIDQSPFIFHFMKKISYTNINMNTENKSMLINHIPPTNDNFRLLDVDNRLILPYNTNIRILISSSDVIHSWTIPELGIKIDAIPGRINQGFIFIKRPGIFFGQCSEICGTNHSFMPIVLESTSNNLFMNWVKNFNK